MNTPIFINMRYFFTYARAFFMAFSVFFLISCAGTPSERIEIPYEKTELPHEKTVETVTAVPERPVPSLYIMGKGIVPGVSLAEFLLRFNTGADRDYVLALSNYYIEEAAAEGINHDIAFAQMILETGFLRFGGDVKPEQNNFCGLGAVGGGAPGLSFPDPRTGVRAHIQHLKGYASAEPLNQELVNPRYRYLVMLNRIGSSPTIRGLTGTWAVDREYDIKIERILNQLYDFSF